MKTTYSIAVPATKVQKEIQLFNNPEFGELRINQDENENIWFSLNDVMKSLALSHVSNLRKRLLPKGCITITAPTKGGNQEMIFIDEPNLYRCIFQSRKKEAEKFQDWVFEEVLPTIRKTGGYIVSHKNETPEMIMARALQVAQQTITNHMQKVQILEGENEIQKEQIKELAPKANYTDNVLQSVNTHTSTEIAKELDMRSADQLHKELEKRGIMFSQSGRWMLTAKYTGKGLTKTRTHNYTSKSTGQKGTNSITVWTEKGRQFIHSLKSEGRL